MSDGEVAVICTACDCAVAELVDAQEAERLARAVRASGGDPLRCGNCPPWTFDPEIFDGLARAKVHRMTCRYCGRVMESQDPDRFWCSCGTGWRRP